MQVNAVTAHGDVLRRQDDLQVEAKAVAVDLQLDELLGTVGDPGRVGSAALRLMVPRGLDITVACRALDGELLARCGSSARPDPALPDTRDRTRRERGSPHQPAPAWAGPRGMRIPLGMDALDMMGDRPS